MCVHIYLGLLKDKLLQKLEFDIKTYIFVIHSNGWFLNFTGWQENSLAFFKMEQFQKATISQQQITQYLKDSFNRCKY